MTVTEYTFTDVGVCAWCRNWRTIDDDHSLCTGCHDQARRAGMLRHFVISHLEPLICECDQPIPELIPLFDCHQCRHCARAILGRHPVRLGLED